MVGLNQREQYSSPQPKFLKADVTVVEDSFNKKDSKFENRFVAKLSRDCLALSAVITFLFKLKYTGKTKSSSYSNSIEIGKLQYISINSIIYSFLIFISERCRRSRVFQ